MKYILTPIYFLANFNLFLVADYFKCKTLSNWNTVELLSKKRMLSFERFLPNPWTIKLLCSHRHLWQATLAFNISINMDSFHRNHLQPRQSQTPRIIAIKCSFTCIYQSKNEVYLPVTRKTLLLFFNSHVSNIICIRTRSPRLNLSSYNYYANHPSFFRGSVGMRPYQGMVVDY